MMLVAIRRLPLHVARGVLAEYGSDPEGNASPAEAVADLAAILRGAGFTLATLDHAIDDAVTSAASYAYHEHHAHPSGCEAYAEHYGRRCPCESYRPDGVWFKGL